MWDQQKKWYYYTKSQRRGFVYFVLLLCSVQVVFLFLELRTFSEVALSEIIDQEKLALYKAEVYQLQQLQQVKKDTIYPFNPN